jgi:hypothetical protein
MPDLIKYAGYGANRDPGMIAEIIGRDPKTLGRVTLLGVELCVQRFDQIPTGISATAPIAVSPMTMMAEAWRAKSGFETYMVRPAQGGMVDGVLFNLTSEERKLVSGWALSEFGWFAPMEVDVVTEFQAVLKAETEGLGGGQDIDRVINGLAYKTYLNDQEKTHRIARAARLVNLRGILD